MISNKIITNATMAWNHDMDRWEIAYTDADGDHVEPEPLGGDIDDSMSALADKLFKYFTGGDDSEGVTGHVIVFKNDARFGRIQMRGTMSPGWDYN